MKVHQIICSKCKASMTSKAGIEAGTVIPCPKCKNKFAVTGSTKEEEVIEDFEVVDDDEEETPKKPPAKPAAKKRAVVEDDEAETPKKPLAKRKAVDDDEDEAPKKTVAKGSARKRDDDDEDKDERPSAKKKGRVVDDDDDEDDSPRSKNKKRDDDDEEDDKPRRKRRGDDDDDEDDDKPKSGYAKLKANPWVRGGVLGGLLIILGVLGYMLWQKNKKNKDDDDTKKEAENAQPINPGPAQPIGQRPVPKAGGNPEEVTKLYIENMNALADAVEQKDEAKAMSLVTALREGENRLRNFKLSPNEQRNLDQKYTQEAFAAGVKLGAAMRKDPDFTKKLNYFPGK